MKSLITIFILLVGSVFSQAVLSVELVANLTSDQIKKLVINTTYHSSTAARNIAILEVKGGMESGCNGVFMDAEINKATYSMLMSAIISGKGVTIHYNPEQHSPWGNATWCALTLSYIQP